MHAHATSQIPIMIHDKVKTMRFSLLCSAQCIFSLILADITLNYLQFIFCSVVNNNFASQQV